MTNNQHGQVPEALIDLIDAYAETRHRCGGIYNARAEAARKAVIEALSGVQALSAAPAIGDELRDTLVAVSAAIAERDDRAAQKMIREILAASPTPPAEQQAAPKAAQGVGNSGFDHKTAADFLNGKTVSDEAVRNFVAAARWAHDEKASLSAMLLSVRGELASREAEIALLKKALLEAEAAPQQEVQEPCGWTTGITWRPDTRLQSEQVIKITRDAQPKYGYTTPIYTAPQPAPATQQVGDVPESHVTHEGGRESVDDALAIVESFGPGIGGLNDAYARQVLLAEEVKRLREQAPNPERTGELLMGLAVIRELTGTQQKGLEETIEAVRAAVNAQKHPPAPATMAVNDDLRDWLVAISAAVADQDDRAAQAMLREILKTPQPSPTAQAAHQPAPDCHHRPPCNECAALAAQGGK